MKDMKKLARIEGIITIVTAALLAFGILYFFLYDANAVGAYNDTAPSGDAGSQFGAGLAKGFSLVFMMIGFIAASVPTGILLILGGVQLGIHNKKGFSRVCTALAMVAKIIAAIAIFWCILFIWEPYFSAFSKILYLSVLLTTISSFAWGISALILRKKIEAMPIQSVHTEEESAPDEVVIYPDGQDSQTEEESAEEEVAYHYEE